MQNAQFIINEIENANANIFHLNGRIMYSNYCENCRTVFNLFDVIENHHENLKKMPDLIHHYTMMREKLRGIIQLYKAGNACNCDTGVTPVVFEDDNEDGEDTVQYNVWSHNLFLHYDYLRFDPAALLPKCEYQIDGDASDDDTLPTYEEARNTFLPPPIFQMDHDNFFANPPSNMPTSFTVDDDDNIFGTPNVHTTAVQPYAPERRYEHNPLFGDDDVVVTNVRRRLAFDDEDDVEDNTHDIAFVQDDEDDDSDVFVFNNPQIIDVDEPEHHPTLLRLIEAGIKPLPTPDSNVYSNSYRLHQRISKQNFLIKKYNVPQQQDDDTIQHTTIHVYRDIPALIQEINFWFNYFNKPHASVLNTTMVSLRPKINSDCMYSIACFMD
jgi:hypothetical protein